MAPGPAPASSKEAAVTAGSRPGATATELAPGVTALASPSASTLIRGALSAGSR